MGSENSNDTEIGDAGEPDSDLIADLETVAARLELTRQNITGISAPGIPSRPEPVDSSVRVSEEHEQRAWVGTRNHLERLVRDIEKSMADAYNQFLASSTETGMAREIAAQSAAKALQLQIRFEANDGRLVRTGSIDSLLKEMDAANVQQVAIENYGRHYGDELAHVKLMFDGRPGVFRTAVSLSVTGSNREWVAGLFGILRSQLRDRYPRWGVFRREATGIVISFASLLWLFVAVYNDLPKPTELQRTAYIFMYSISATVGGLIIHSTFTRLFPGFELVEDGKQPRGRQVLGGLVTLVSIALGVAGILLAL